MKVGSVWMVKSAFYHSGFKGMKLKEENKARFSAME